jgi:hypothetical protein
MLQSTITASGDSPVSPLILCDRLLTLAQDVDRAGLRGAARHLLDLAGEVLEPVRPARPAAARRR